MTTGGVLYTCVADQNGILAAVKRTDEAEQVGWGIMGQIDLYGDQVQSIPPSEENQGMGVHYIVENYVCFLCVSSDDCPDRTAYTFLKNVKNDFFSTLQAEPADQLQAYLEGQITELEQMNGLATAKDNSMTEVDLKKSGNAADFATPPIYDAHKEPREAAAPPPSVPSRSTQAYAAAAATVAAPAKAAAYEPPKQPAEYSYSVSVLNTSDYAEPRPVDVKPPLLWYDYTLWMLALLVLVLILTILAILIGIAILVWRYAI